MKCPECGKEFPEAVRGSVDGDGVYRLRDENSRIVHSHPTREHMKALGSMGMPARQRKEQAADALFESIMAALENPSDQEARENARRVLLKQLTAIASETKSAKSLEALRSLSAEIGQAFSSIKPPSRPDQPCRLCGRVEGQAQIILGEAQAARLVEIFEGRERERMRLELLEELAPSKLRD